MATLQTHCRVLLVCAFAGMGAASLAKDVEAPPPVPTAPAVPSAMSALSVIELPPLGAGLPGAARQRVHHALSLATDAPKPFFRSLGIDATDCALRLRLPSRIVAPTGNANMRLDLQLQAGLGCKF